MLSQTYLPIMILATTVATITATVTGKRAFGPNAINAPTAIPAAGQKTANPGLARKTRPSRAAKK
jgi:hypothetical protein